MYYPVIHIEKVDDYLSELHAIKDFLIARHYKEVNDINFHQRPNKNYRVFENSDGTYFRVQVSFKENLFEFIHIECWYEDSFKGRTLSKYRIGVTFGNAGHYEGSKMDETVFASSAYHNDHLIALLMEDVKDAINNKKRIKDWL